MSKGGAVAIFVTCLGGKEATMPYVGAGTINNDTLASLSVAPVVAQPAPSSKKGKKGKKGKKADKKLVAAICADDVRVRNTCQKLSLQKTDVIQVEFSLPDGRVLIMENPEMLMNREAGAYVVCGNARTTLDERMVQEVFDGITARERAASAVKNADAEDAEEAAVEAIMRAPMTAREVTSVLMTAREHHQAQLENHAEVVEEDEDSDEPPEAVESPAPFNAGFGDEDSDDDCPEAVESPAVLHVPVDDGANFEDADFEDADFDDMDMLGDMGLQTSRPPADDFDMSEK